MATPLRLVSPPTNPLPLLMLAVTLPWTPSLAGEIVVGVPEPSAIDIDRAGGRIFVADDGGEVWVFDRDYTATATFAVGGDL